MPRGIYIRTKKYKKHLRTINLGKKLSETTKEKLRLVRLGTKHSEETKSEMRKKFKGNKNPNWKGGIAFKASIRDCFKYRQWRSDIFTRDDFTCQWCKIKGERLNADHYPKAFSVIIKEYNIKTLEEALVCEELWNLNNGRTLCINCHKKTDTYLKNNKK